MKRVQLVLYAWLIAAAACAPAGPAYQRVDPALPKNFGSLEPGVTNPGPVPHDRASAWWKIFKDSNLDSLIERAVLRNPDLRIAETRVRQARALRGTASSSFYPEGGAGADYRRYRSTQAGFAGGIRAGGGSSGSQSREGDLYQAGFDASWEIDIFGSIRRRVEAADADLAASEEAWRDALVSLQGEVARNYIELRALQLRRDIASEDVEARQENLELNESRFKAGLITELEVARTRGALINARSAVPSLENSILAVMHRIGVLLGEDPMRLVKELGDKAELPPMPGDLPTGLPSDLLRRRPDIRKAERELAAATARIGVSKAELFPRFSLTGSFGLQSGTLKDLTDEGNRYWQIGPSIRWNILNLKRILSEVEASEAIRDESLVRYEKSVLVALEEVENALATLSWEKRRAEILAEGVRTSSLAVTLALSRHRAGLESYLAVLDAQAAFLLSQDQLALSRQNACLGLVALYKALGGGWRQEGYRQNEGVPQSEEGAARVSAPPGG